MGGRPLRSVQFRLILSLPVRRSQLEIWTTAYSPLLQYSRDGEGAEPDLSHLGYDILTNLPPTYCDLVVHFVAPSSMHIQCINQNVALERSSRSSVVVVTRWPRCPWWGRGVEGKGRDGLAAFDGNDISGEKAGDGRDAVGNCFLLPPQGCRING